MGIGKRDWVTPGKIDEQLVYVGVELEEVYEVIKEHGWASKSYPTSDGTQRLVVIYDTWDNLGAGEKGR